MKINCRLPVLGTKRKVIARFGSAKLVRTSGRAYELHGGSDEDHAEALEWVSLFLHEAVIRRVAAPGNARQRPCAPAGQTRETVLCG